jgi:hypothetical protein
MPEKNEKSESKSNKYAREVQFDTPYYKLLSILISHGEYDSVIESLITDKIVNTVASSLEKDLSKLLICACIENHPVLIKFLLDFKADPEIVSIHGTTPIMYAAQADNLDIVKHFIDVGVDPFKTYGVIDKNNVEREENIWKYAKENVQDFLQYYTCEISKKNREYVAIEQSIEIEPQIVDFHDGLLVSIAQLIDNAKVVKILKKNEKLIDAIVSIMHLDWTSVKEIQYGQKDASAPNVISTVKYVYGTMMHTRIKSTLNKLLVELLMLMHFNNKKSESIVGCDPIRFSQSYMHFDNLNTSMLFDVTICGEHAVESFDLKDCVLINQVFGPNEKQCDVFKELLLYSEQSDQYELLQDQFNRL